MTVLEGMNSCKTVKCKVNGSVHSFKVGSGEGCIPASRTLAEVLREMLLLTGTKTACNEGGCGACSVLMNGVPTLSCSTLIADCDGAEIVTVEGLADPATGELHPVQPGRS